MVIFNIHTQLNILTSKNAQKFPDNPVNAATSEIFTLSETKIWQKIIQSRIWQTFIQFRIWQKKLIQKTSKFTFYSGTSLGESKMYTVCILFNSTLEDQNILD